MKSTITLFLCSILLSLSAHAQEAASSRYFEERARGDAAADASRYEFGKSVCEIAVSTFCPGFKRSPKKTCFETQKECGSPRTVVEKRFISKYGVGLTSANRDVLPTIKRTFQVLKEIDSHSKSKKISPSVQTRLPFITQATGLSRKEVEINFQQFSQRYFPKKLKTITIDYWGYFQQSSVAQPEFSFDERENAGSLLINFRWCSQQKRFIDESSRMVGYILSAAVMNSDQIENYASSESYQAACDNLPVERGDQ